MLGIKPKGGMFGADPPWSTPPIWQGPQAGEPMPETPPGAGMAPRLQGGFNAPGGWADKLGMLSDTLLNRDTFTNQIMQRRQQQMAQQQYQQRRADTQTDWLAQQEYERAHPKPINNDTVNDYQFRVQTLGQAAADEWLRNQGDPIVTVPLGQDRIYSGPRSGLGAALGGAAAPSGASGPPMKPVGKLTPLGGASQPGSRTFP